MADRPSGMDTQPDDLRGEVTRLLAAARAGDQESLDRVFPIIYDELRGLARRQLRREQAPRTIQATALVHEAYLKLAGGRAVRASDRGHLVAIAARAMRQVLVDEARRRTAAKRGGNVLNTTLSDQAGPLDLDPEELLTLDQAIERLEPRQRRVVELRFFAGMEEEEIAQLLDISERTVRRDWVKARAWLYRSLYPEPHTASRSVESEALSRSAQPPKPDPD
jgi:RNA polymerase sigma factor (TIGR02999 family)